jgi:hypothetical protein
MTLMPRPPARSLFAGLAATFVGRILAGGVAAFDYDNDGRMDLFLRTELLC